MVAVTSPGGEPLTSETLTWSTAPQKEPNVLRLVAVPLWYRSVRSPHAVSISPGSSA